jgi:hypothetical protein
VLGGAIHFKGHYNLPTKASMIRTITMMTRILIRLIGHLL